jgi:hypothetical protein
MFPAFPAMKQKLTKGIITHQTGLQKKQFSLRVKDLDVSKSEWVKIATSL